ncbi:MAG: S-methyl-5-thioribose-1-phosphate isomerase [Actinobacteria bacterium RBG_19FT_COMBO_54_7]|uniref:Methylthioribose-1-phosphate isomerase n=1 Tax=Candidatus Solincola sediminis TaxID=1797199 RepID=A0A1F2WU22_9ACTN|nr:MAG: S-methyl-5-thioribose-1-phosphate isomerase [Candidatus Solincola sediminis]OFW60325.1 MAG: S-methyl-5-thioribose-1-phosphate isomerase [Candidatus Solincola sediminis]OFW65582.1 MAG: S-methyl-5-thioribose-1-phosphate isomerase [Actinobacteria bacterium RBG_19FT_COMBO_54_7]
MSEFRAVDWRDGKVILLDQTRLPHEESYLEINDWREVAEAIRSMRVRGAPAIGIAAAYAMALAAADSRDVFAAADELAGTRPTAVNLFWAIERMKRAASEAEPGQLAQRLLQEANAIAAEQDAADHTIGELGAELLPDDCRVLTHCNAGGLATYSFGTALGVIKAAHRQGKQLFVWVDETRPLLQGARLTAWELEREGVPMALITDNMAGHLISTGQVDAVITGADRIAANGDTANKIGTYGLAVLANRHRIPFYIAAPLSTVDLSIPDGRSIPIEEREPDEVKSLGGKQITGDKVAARNFAFDVTPAELISAIISEKGIIRQPLEAGMRKLAMEDDGR